MHVEVLQNGEWNCPWFAENRLCIWHEGDLRRIIFEVTQFWLEKIRKFRAELLAGLMQCVIGLVVLQDGMYIITAGVDPGLL